MDSYKETAKTWDKLAMHYQEKFMGMDLYNDTYDLFCEKILKVNPAILEIGCGPGNITKYMLSKRTDFQIEGIDSSPNMIKLAIANCPDTRFMVMDCREIDTLKSKYDAIVCGFCMPYLSKADCTKLIRDCRLLLNEGGVFYFSLIEGDYSSSGYEASSSGEDRAFVYYYQEKEIAKLVQENGFELLDLIRKPYPNAALIRSEHLIFIVKKMK